jgi:ribonuclease HI
MVADRGVDVKWIPRAENDICDQLAKEAVATS